MTRGSIARRSPPVLCDRVHENRVCLFCGRTVFGHHRQERVDESDYLRRKIEHTRGERHDALLRQALENLPERLALDGTNAREALVCHDPERPRVRSRRHRLGPQDLLGRHVVRRAQDDAGLGELRRCAHCAEGLGQTKVEKLYLLSAEGFEGVPDQKDVLRLYVPMHDAVLVSERESSSEARQNPTRPL